jgi:CTP:molybdopterin cytidylyltransferase MocA
MEGDSLYGERLAGFEVDEGESVNIDGPEDFARAERLLGGRLASL